MVTRELPKQRPVGTREDLQSLAAAGRGNEAVDLLLRHSNMALWVAENICKAEGADLASIGTLSDPVAFSVELVECLESEEKERAGHVARLREFLRRQIDGNASLLPPDNE